MEEKNMIDKQPLSDDELVAMFFEGNRQEIEDDGFSQHVMKQLPSQSIRISRIWTLVCSVVGVAFFFLADGIGQLKLVLFNATGNFVGFLASIDFHSWSPLMVLAAIGLLMVFGAWNIAENWEYRERLSQTFK